MADKALILIPDISGYTEFLTRTELEHGAQIIHELLDLVVRSNETKFTLGEVEGDALLYYRKGEPLDLDTLARQCVTMFVNFHKQLMLIDRDTICHCGACGSASSLSLKFIVHYGAIKEIQVSHFLKAIGLDMVIAHKLLKNRIPSTNYILVTQAYMDAAAQTSTSPELVWSPLTDEYPAVGTVRYYYALLDRVKSQLPKPPDRAHLIVDLGDDSFQADIEAPLLEVYQRLIDLDQRHHWIPGLRRLERKEITERAGMQHVCVFDDMSFEAIALGTETPREGEMIYMEEGTLRELKASLRMTYMLKALGPHRTSLTSNLKWTGGELPKDTRDGVLAMVKVELENFKNHCEECIAKGLAMKL